MLSLRIDASSRLPVFEQLREQLSAQIAVGSYPRGAKLPGVREIASRLGINSNTVNRAYAELERQGIVATRRGLGTFVASKPRSKRGMSARQLALKADRFVIEGFAVGCSGHDMLGAIEHALERQSGPMGYSIHEGV